jgi:hypothetical protein
MGLIAIGAGFLFQLNRTKLATVVGLISGTIVLAFYLYCFIKQPEKDANYRVAWVIVASLAEIVFVLLPKRNVPPA